LIPGDEFEEIVNSPAWRDLAAPDESGRLMAKFRRRALIEECSGNLRDAVVYSLCAVWAADDTKNVGASVARRRETAERMRRWLHAGSAESEEVLSVRVQMIDVLRRADLWSEASDHANALLADPSTEGRMADVIRFQIELISRRDGAAYTLGDIKGATDGDST
jgi:hypothetical protein